MISLNEYERYMKEVARFQKQATDFLQKATRAYEVAMKAQQAAQKTKSLSTAQIKLREFDKKTKEALAAEKRRSEYERKATQSLQKANNARIKYEKENQRQQQQAIRKLEQQARQQLSASSASRVLRNIQHSNNDDVETIEYDAFISHASEDKDEIAQPLYDELTKLGLNIWFDKTALKVGNSLRGKIDEGLSQSNFGIVILSHNFFQKNWSKAELNGFFSREMISGEEIILPIWHRITKEEVLKHSPMLVDRTALNTSIHTLSEIALALKNVIRPQENN